MKHLLLLLVLATGVAVADCEKTKVPAHGLCLPLYLNAGVGRDLAKNLCIGGPAVQCKENAQHGMCMLALLRRGEFPFWQAEKICLGEDAHWDFRRLLEYLG